MTNATEAVERLAYLVNSYRYADIGDFCETLEDWLKDNPHTSLPSYRIRSALLDIADCIYDVVGSDYPE